MGTDFIKQDNFPKIPQNPWVENLFRPVLLIGMITCLSIAMVNLAKTFNPSWHETYFLVGMIVVTIEAVYSYRILQKQGRIRYITFRYRLVEWGTILLFLKALTYVNTPWRTAVADIQSWGAKPLNMFSMKFVIMCLLSCFIWSAATNTMKVFNALFDRFLITSQAIDPFSNLTNRFYYGGGLLIVISGTTQWISRSGLGILTDFNRPSIKGVFFTVLIYFVLGLILLSQTQLYIHCIGWQLQKLDVPANLKKRWTIHGITLLVIVGAAIFFLPTSYTLGFLTSVKLMLQYGIHTVLSIAQLTWVIIIFPLRLLLSLFPLDNVEFQEDSRDQPVLSPESDISAPDSDAVYSFIFWLVLLAVVVYLLRTYVKDHPELLKWLKHLRLPYSWLARLWQWLKGGAHAVIEFIPRPVTLYTEEPDPKTGLKRRRFRLGKMSTRQHIIYYYLNTLKHAEKSGLIRQQSQTPAEFATRLAKVLPDMDAEIDRLTETFVHARYSRDAFSQQQALSVKGIWRTIRSALRGIKRQK